MSGLRWYELAMSVVTIAGSWMVGNKSRWGMRMNMVAILAWWVYIPLAQAWGLIPMQIAFLVVGTRNLIKWEREYRETYKPYIPTHMEMG